MARSVLQTSTLQSLGSVLHLLQLPAMLGEVGALTKPVPAERVFGDHVFFQWESCELTARVDGGCCDTCAWQYVRVWVPWLVQGSPQPFHHLWLPARSLHCTAVKETINFNGNKILGGSRQCQEHPWTASWKQFQLQIVLTGIALSFLTAGTSTRNLCLS